MQKLWINDDNLLPPIIYRNLTEINQEQGKNPYSHFMRRAWNIMGLNAIYCINKKPTIYFKEVNTIQNEEINEIHKQFWNQGIATLLVISSKTKIYIYSGLVPPIDKSINEGQDNRLLKVLDNTTQALENYNLIQQVETGKIYRDHRKYFQQKHSVDRILLENLSEVRKQIFEVHKSNKNLKEDEILKIIHKLLGRIIFVCYLVDRDIIGEQEFNNAEAKNVKNLKGLFNSPNIDIKSILYKLFTQLKTYFNGSMFDDDLLAEEILINDNTIRILKDFLNGVELKMGQHRFDFWVYDFSVIPIETISAMYEDFLAAESSTGKRNAGAFYTPKNLAEMLVDVAVETLERELLGKRFFDPACGSGIFLVILFNRIAGEWDYKNPNANTTERAKALNNIIKNQLCGVDINETACRITCFSLYLAFLDQLAPVTIHDLQKEHGQVLENILALAKDTYSTTQTPVIYEGNFFDSKLPLANDFDLIIGNPPWVGRKKEGDTYANIWYQSNNNPFLQKAPGKKQERDSYFQPNKEIAHLFMWKTPLHIKKTGYICLLLPSKVFLNKTDSFQVGWFRRFTIEKIIQLADLRRVLFENASHPAVIVKFNAQQSEQDYYFDYVIPKVSRDDPRLGTVTILNEDCKKLSPSEIIHAAFKEEAPIVWKKYFWGIERTHELLERLLSLPRLEDIADNSGKKRWLTGQGFKPFNQTSYQKSPKVYGKPKPVLWDSHGLYIDGKKKQTGLLLFKSDYQKVPADIIYLYCSPNKELFHPPMVITNQGYTWKSFCDFPVFFQHSLQSISGKKEDKKLLMFLCAVLNTKLADFFHFHTSANRGIERPKVHFFELLRLPFPLPEDTDNPEKSNAIIDQVAEIFANLKQEIETSLLGNSEKIAEACRELEPLVYDYYDISTREQILIEDTVNIFIPSSTPSTLYSKIPTLNIPTKEEKKIYIDLVCEVLNKLAKRSPFKVSAKLITSGILDIVKFTKDTDFHPYEEYPSPQEITVLLKKIRDGLPNEKRSFTYLRNLKVFDGNDLYIIKPLTLRHWTRTMALEDAAKISKSILLAGRNN